MTSFDFWDAVRGEPRDRLDSPYERPCRTWVRRLEVESGLTRKAGAGRAYVWSIRA